MRGAYHPPQFFYFGSSPLWLLRYGLSVYNS